MLVIVREHQIRCCQRGGDCVLLCLQRSFFAVVLGGWVVFDPFTVRLEGYLVVICLAW